MRSKWLLVSTEKLYLFNMALFRSRDAIKMADCCQSFYGRGGSVTETWDWLHAILTTGPLGQTSYRTRRRVGVDGNWWLFDCATAFPFFFVCRQEKWTNSKGNPHRLGCAASRSWPCLEVLVFRVWLPVSFFLSCMYIFSLTFVFHFL